MTEAAISLKGVSKRFGTVQANKNIDLEVAKGSIHGVIGENGAGKSTLMNILYGLYQADTGTIRIGGVEKTFKSPEDAIDAGVGMVHQHFMLVETFTVLENMLLGHEGGFQLAPGARKAREEIGALGKEYGLDVPLDALISDLPVGVQQRVEILKALYRGADILILDEPTGVLTPQEADDLFRILDNLRAQGRAILLITHKLKEIMAATDAVSVMRRGEMVAHRATSATDTEELAELMVGRKVLLRVEKTKAMPAEPVLEVEKLEVEDDLGALRVKGIDLAVRRGEIVGVAGVAGNGQSELLEAIAGIRAPRAGAIRIEGDAAGVPGHGRLQGLGHVPEDRLRLGLVKGFAAKENAILGYQERADYASEQGVLKLQAIERTCAAWMSAYDVRPQLTTLEATSFSGGNQQKLVMAREIEHDPKLLLVGQPTRGVDIGAIEFIHKRLIEMRDRGVAVLVVSVELDEILSLADRIVVMFDGVITGELAAEEADERKLGLLMAGVTEEAA